MVSCTSCRGTATTTSCAETPLSLACYRGVDGGAEPITFRLQKQFTPTRGAGAVPSGSLPGSPLFPANRPPQRNLRFLVQGVILRGFQGALFHAVPVFHLRFSTLKPMMENKIS